MATPKLLLSKLLRRRPPTLTTLSSSSSLYSHSSLSSSYSSSSYSIFLPQSSDRSTPKINFGLPPSAALRYHFLSSRSLSSSSSTRDSEYGGKDPSLDSATRLEDDLGFSSSAYGGGGGGDDFDGLQVAETLVDASAAAIDDGEESILPVRALISLLDCYHDFTGWPWWVIIASSTLALRSTLLPMLIFQLKKLKKIAESAPKLPPPMPPPLSGRSYIDHFLLFRRERRAIGCPSYLWFLAIYAFQVPCFFLWMTTVRRMSLDHYPGFDCGGTLWFQNLTDLPHGFSGAIFPLLIASLHLVSVQISFRAISSGKLTGLFGLLAKYFRIYMNLLALPIVVGGFFVPQGSLVYWATNSSLTVVQQLALNNPGVREKLGLLKLVKPVPTANRGEMGTPGEIQGDLPRKQQKIHTQHLSPRELLSLSVKRLAEGHKDRAMPLLRLALDKDPEYVRALVVMGQTLLQNGQLAEATEYLERAISKLFLMGHPTEVEELDLLILASQWAGIASIRQGKNAAGIRHLERVTNLKEPEDTKTKAHYYDAFLVLASALYNEGRKDEAFRYLRALVAYDASYNEYLEQCEKDEVDLVRDLTSSRRGDY